MHGHSGPIKRIEVLNGGFGARRILLDGVQFPFRVPRGAAVTVEHRPSDEWSTASIPICLDDDFEGVVMRGMTPAEYAAFLEGDE